MIQICMQVSKNCINIDSYGVMCVHCGCCEEYNPNVKDRTEKQIKSYNERLQEEYNFDNYSENEEMAEIQRKNVETNIKYFKEMIEKLEHFFDMLKEGAVDGNSTTDA